MKTRFSVLLALCVATVLPPTAAFAAKGYSKLDEMSLDRWAKLREIERYQMNIAEKYYRESNWKIAADEYESYLAKYEQSEGASYAQLKWSICQVKLKKLNTAVKDGFQTVIDYWPESPEAVAAAYLIGKTYKEMGDLGPAKAAYSNVTTKHADEMVAVMARLDMADIARIEQDRERRISVLKDLVFNAPRVGDAGRQIEEASRTLAGLLFTEGAFAEGKDSLATTYKEPTLAGQVNEYIREPITRLVADAATKDKGLKVADAAISYFNEQMPTAATNEDEQKLLKGLTYYTADVNSAAGRFDETMKIYEKMLSQFKDQDDVFDRYAGWLKTRGKRDEARILYGRMKDQLAGQSRIAYSWREENKPLQAIPIYEDLMARDSAKASTWQWTLGECYREAGKYKEAIAVYQQCDNFPTNLQMIASCYRSLKQYKEAIGTYAQIVGAYESAAPSALLNIGYTHEAMGNSETAISTFQQVCKRYPRSGEASQAHQHLNNKYKITFTLGGEKAQ
jgi:tetratricopeptide (TPR) repeat protein